jgi:lipid A 4'-phosphatase
MKNRFLNVQLYIWLSFVLLSLIFIFVPQIDIFVSHLFYDGKTFPANHTFLEEFFYRSVQPMILLFAISSFLIFLYNTITKKSILNINAKVLLYLFLVLAVAPGLIVNVVLKDNWGRPRPAQTIEFGGKMNFTPPFVIGKQEGYSFPSGHSAAAFSLLGFALLAKRRRKVWMNLAFSYGTLVSIARMSSGGHFLSDVVTSFFIVYIFTHIFYKLIFKEDSIA